MRRAGEKRRSSSRDRPCEDEWKENRAATERARERDRERSEVFGETCILRDFAHDVR